MDCEPLNVAQDVAQEVVQDFSAAPSGSEDPRYEQRTGASEDPGYEPSPSSGPGSSKRVALLDQRTLKILRSLLPIPPSSLRQVQRHSSRHHQHAGP